MISIVLTELVLTLPIVLGVALALVLARVAGR
jgi:hypothetical protein